MKRLLVLLLALLMLLPAAKTEEVPSAWREAVLHVPASAMPSAMEEKDGLYSFLFEDGARSIAYHVELLPGSLHLTSLQMANNQMKGSARATYASTKLENLTKEYYPGTAWQGTYLLKEDGLSRFVLFLLDEEDGNFYRLEYDAATGDMMGYTVREDLPAEAGDTLLSMKQAVQAALAFAGQGTLMDVRLVKTENGYVYRVLLLIGGEEVLVIVDAQTGACFEEARQATAYQAAGSSRRRSPAQSTGQGAGGQTAQQAERDDDDDDDDWDDDDDDWDDDDD